MTVFLRENRERSFWVRYGRRTLDGITLSEAVLPYHCSERRLAGVARRLEQDGIRRFLPIGELRYRTRFARFLPEVTPLPLYRALADRLALAWVAEREPRERRVALRGNRVDGSVRAAAESLCPQVGTLLLDFERGGEELARYLHRRYGVAPLTGTCGQPPHIAVEFSERGESLPDSLRLWGEAELLGMTVRWDGAVPDEVPTEEWLTLLWEVGRLPLSEFRVERR